MNYIIYLPYFLFKTNYQNLFKSLKCAQNEKNTIFLILDMLKCSIIYGTSFIDYFNFRFYQKSNVERSKYATMAVMYRFHKKINDQSKIHLVDNKLEFAKHFSKYKMKTFCFGKDDINLFSEFVKERANKIIVIKDIDSTAGKGVSFSKVTFSELGDVNIDLVDYKDWFHSMFSNSNLLYIEDYLTQHHKLNSISPSGLNTVRVITLLAEDKVHILGAAFRISVDSKLDNFSAGNLAADIEIDTGRILHGGIRKLSACDSYHKTHPITGAKIKDEIIPFWNEVIDLVRNAARIIPEVRSIGWDVAILENGPILIEGNSKWNKDTWQIPANQGRLERISEYM